MKILLQLAGVLGLCFLGDVIAAYLPFSFPGNAIAMILLFLGFLSGVFRPSHFRETGDFFLGNMTIFFIPGAVGLMECFGEIKSALIPIFLICIISTVLTFAATAFTVRVTVYLQKRFRTRREQRG